jgi:hypothetical protein
VAAEVGGAADGEDAVGEGDEGKSFTLVVHVGDALPSFLLLVVAFTAV